MSWTGRAPSAWPTWPQACHGDFRLRASVESVLVALKDARQFMDVADIRADNFADFVGESAGEYRLVELLGISPLGAVYRATDDKDHEFAVRVVRGHLWARELIERFTDELDIYSRVRHPGIASLLDGGVTVNGSPYVVYEFVDGVSIDEYCDRHRLDLRQRVAMLRRVCLAAHAGHAHLTAWRSLRPSNVLVTADGVPRLLDFALATLLHRQHGPVLSNDTTMKSMWVSQFAAPETYEGVDPTGHRRCVLAGRHGVRVADRAATHGLSSRTSPRPRRVAKASEQVRGNTDWALRKAIAHRRSTSPRALARALTGDLDAVLDKATRRDPDAAFRFGFGASRGRSRVTSIGQPLALDDDRLRGGELVENRRLRSRAGARRGGCRRPGLPVLRSRPVLDRRAAKTGRRRRRSATVAAGAVRTLRPRSALAAFCVAGCAGPATVATVVAARAPRSGAGPGARPPPARPARARAWGAAGRLAVGRCRRRTRSLGRAGALSHGRCRTAVFPRARGLWPCTPRSCPWR